MGVSVLQNLPYVRCKASICISLLQLDNRCFWMSLGKLQVTVSMSSSVKWIVIVGTSWSCCVVTQELMHLNHVALASEHYAVLSFSLSSSVIFFSLFIILIFISSNLLFFFFFCSFVCLSYCSFPLAVNP